MTSILIVDDDEILRAVAGEMLRQSDHCVVEAEDGLVALRLVDALPIDLVILDMLMPNMDGFEVISEIRRRYPTVRILAISGGGLVDGKCLLTTARVLGADGCLSKPLTRVMLEAAIAEVMGQTSESLRSAQR